MLNSRLVILKKGKLVTVSHQYALGLLLSAIGSFMLPLGIKFANSLGYMAFNWMFIYSVLQAIAELCIGPIGYSMVGQLIPVRWQSLCMGTTLLNSGVAAVFASFFSNYAIGPSKTLSPLITNPFYSRAFTQLGLLTLGVAIVLFLAIPFVKRLINGNAAFEKR